MKPGTELPAVLPQPAPETLMAGADPIWIDQGRRGILFLHGYTSSAFEGRFLAEYFGERGWGVWAPLLPGHGTRPEDLVTVTAADWLGAAERAFDWMRERFDQVVVCGQSMGGALALHLAATRPVDAVVTLAGAMFVRDWRLRLLPVARHVIRYQYKSKGPDIRDAESKAAIASYHKYPLSSLEQFLGMIRRIRAELPKVTAPALVVHSRRDRTIHYANLATIAESIGSAVRETLSLEESYHVISVDVEREMIFRKMDEFLSGALPAEGELDGGAAAPPNAR